LAEGLGRHFSQKGADAGFLVLSLSCIPFEGSFMVLEVVDDCESVSQALFRE
jgi:hypothetical protein